MRYKGDNYQAFDGKPIEVEFDTDGKVVSRALFVINNGVIVKEFENPISPLEVELSEEDTIKLDYRNIANLILYDEQGRKQTCDGQLEFFVSEEVYIESEV